MKRTWDLADSIIYGTSLFVIVGFAVFVYLAH